MSSSQAVADVSNTILKLVEPAQSRYSWDVQYFLGSYTTMGIHLFGHIVWDVTRGQLTQHLSNHVEALVDEISYGFTQKLPACEGACAGSDPLTSLA